MKQSIAVFLAVIMTLPGALSGQGFISLVPGSKPRFATLHRLLPATVNLNGKRIRVEATSAAATAKGDVIVVLKTKLVTAVQKDPRFIVDETKPETLLRFTVTNFYLDRKDYKVGTGQTSNHCTKYVGKMDVSYQAIEVATGAPLDSENLTYAINIEDQNQPKDSKTAITQAEQDTTQNTTQTVTQRGVGAITGLGGRIAGFGSKNKQQPQQQQQPKLASCGSSGKDTMHEAQDDIIDQIVHQMYQRAAPSEEQITAAVPIGKLDQLSTLAVNGRWGKLEEDASNMEKFSNPGDDAYRIYLIALAEEAQAYELAREAAARESGKDKSMSAQEADASFQRAQKLLDEARKNYGDALNARPKEEFFRAPDVRMETAIGVYATIQRHKEEYEKYLAEQKANPGAAPAAIAQNTGEARGQTPPIAGKEKTPLQQVLDYCTASVDSGTITDYIKDDSFLDDAKKTSYKFDFHTDPLALKSACGDKASTYQQLIRTRLANKP